MFLVSLERLRDSRIGRLASRVVSLMPSEQPVLIPIGPLAGMRWIIGSSVRSCWLGLYERDKLRLLTQQLGEGDAFFDVGAQAGYHSLLASRCVGPTGTVYSFEPLPRNTGYLAQHIEINGLSNVQLIRSAVSDSEGTINFDPGAGFMAGRISGEGSLPVPVLAIDPWMERTRPLPPRLMKIDVEGGERRVLLGAERTIRQFKPVIALDTHDFLGGDSAGVHRACCELLSRWGYRISQDADEKPRFARSVVAFPA